MTTFKLPETLGGGEFEGTEGWSGCAGARAEYQIGGITLTMPPGVLLTVVPSPLRPEPMPGTVVLDRHNRAWQYVPSGRGDWGCTLDDLGADWEELNREHGPLIELGSAPEPVEPVQLPWKKSGVEVDRTVSDGAPGNHVHVSTKAASYGYAHLKPAVAREMARALVTAADAVEATS